MWRDYVISYSISWRVKRRWAGGKPHDCCVVCWNPESKIKSKRISAKHLTVITSTSIICILLILLQDLIYCQRKTWKSDVNPCWVEGKCGGEKTVIIILKPLMFWWRRRVALCCGDIVKQTGGRLTGLMRRWEDWVKDCWETQALLASAFILEVH